MMGCIDSELIDTSMTTTEKGKQQRLEVSGPTLRASGVYGHVLRQELLGTYLGGGVA